MEFEKDLFPNKVDITYAETFKVTYHKTYKEVEVTRPWKNAESGFKYWLVPKGMSVPRHDSKITVIEIPVERVVALSTTHLPMFDQLQQSASIVGFPHTDYISSPAIRKLVDEGKVTDLGPDGALNTELLLSVQPDMVMAYGMGNQTDQLDVIKKTGIPVVVNADYMEDNPLGRAEWIKFTALFFNKEKQAQKVFERIRSSYDSLRVLSQTAKNKPKVFSGTVYGDIWYTPGGKSWGAQFLQDAGADYLWKETEGKGSLELSFEAVYDLAHKADYWVGVGAFKSLKEMEAQESRYQMFKAFENQQVYNYNAKEGEKGGNTYLELGYARPDIVLADLIKVFHPELLPDYQPYFYQRLK
ncbi:ABC transporter substrate-binding protein [Xanthovirga aplysinae]|uniref:ABC transporter substrate-binding protein n=1 Tax=Xanthovirga aplysinae TaxID=2529853 RepID=UPI0016574C45